MRSQWLSKFLFVAKSFQTFGQRLLFFPIVLTEHAIMPGKKYVNFEVFTQSGSSVRREGRSLYESGVSQVRETFAEYCYSKAAGEPGLVFNFLRHPKVAETKSAAVQKLLPHKRKHHAFVQKGMDSLALRGMNGVADYATALRERFAQGGSRGPQRIYWFRLFFDHVLVPFQGAYPRDSGRDCI
jgi:hypothetical protein